MNIQENIHYSLFADGTGLPGLSAKIRHVFVLPRYFLLASHFLAGAVVWFAARKVKAEQEKERRMQLKKGAGRGWYAGLAGLLLMVSIPGLGEVQAGPTHTAQEQRPLQFGLLPYMSTRKLFAYYTPLQRYLERMLKRPVRMSTAPDFATYIARARRGEYDLYHTAPHFAAQAEQAFSYRRLSRLTRELDGSIIVARNGPIKSAADLRGRTLRTPDALAIITFLGEQWLRENGLIPGIDVEVSHSPSHNNAILAVARGEAEAAVTSAAVFENMPQKISSHLRILTSTKKVPHMMFMAGPRLSEREFQRLSKIMLEYTSTGAGKVFFTNTGYGSMGPILDKDMHRLNPFVAELNARIQRVNDSSLSVELRR
jgi:phosphonate transport system substrate-binding protein